MQRTAAALVAMVAGSLWPVFASAQLQVSGTAPARQVMADPQTAVSVTFDQALNPATVTSATLRVFGSASGTKTGPFVFSDGDRTVTLTPTTPFSAGEVVSVNLSHDIHAAGGAALRSAGYAYAFTVRTQ